MSVQPRTHSESQGIASMGKDTKTHKPDNGQESRLYKEIL